MTEEIIDTYPINGLNLYVVRTASETGEIRFMYYEDGKVYNYDIQNDILTLLYNFQLNENYNTIYRPICDPDFNYDSLVYKEYTILMDSIVDFEMPDNSMRRVQYVTVQDTVDNGYEISIKTDSKRSILDGVGFLEGGSSLAHDWEIGMYVCDNFFSWIGKLRCFESDSIRYNFVGYPCDSTWVLSSVDEISDIPSITLYPNPTTGQLFIKGVEIDVNYKLYSIIGELLESGKSKNRSISIIDNGVYIVCIEVKGNWIPKRIVRI